MTPQMRAVETYLEHGISVLPLRHGSKLPAGRWKHLQSIPMAADVAATWWNGIVQPIAGVGIVTGSISRDLAVLDIEPEHVPYVNQNVKLPDTGVVTTARGGLHIYCRGQVRSGKLSVADRTVGDIRGRGGYVVAPPTIIGPGQYGWAIPADFANLADVPTWALPPSFSARSTLTPPRASRFQPDLNLYRNLPSKLQVALTNPRQIQQNSWSEFVYWVAIECIYAGLEYDEIEGLLEDSLGDYLADRAGGRGDPGFLIRTYENAQAVVDEEASNAVSVRVFDMAEFGSLAPMRGGLIAQTRLNVMLAVCNRPDLVPYRIPRILSDGSVSVEYRQFLDAFGAPAVEDLIVPKGRARAVIQNGVAKRLLRR